MTTLHLDENPSLYQIKSYKPGALEINDQIFTRSLIITPTELITDWPPQHSNEINADSLELVRALKPDILLIGTGEIHLFLATEIYGDLLNHGIGVEIMSTSAACRTFNALSAEERRVVAALIIT